MRSSSYKGIAVALLVINLIVVGAFSSAHLLVHESQPVHHQQATHGTVLCFLMCAAGTVLDVEVILIQPQRSPVAVVSLSYMIQVLYDLPWISPSRAPPHFS